MASYFGGRRGNKKKLADNVNLIPFIDLFSTLIIFLLMTAVWDQLAYLQSNMGDQAGGKSVEVPKDAKKVKQDTKITVTDEYVEVFDQGKANRFAIEGRTFDIAPLQEFMQFARDKYVDKKDMVIIATDKSKYETIITVMDEVIGKGFTDVILTGMGE
jgi:biopolymer transport protein ExbD